MKTIISKGSIQLDNHEFHLWGNGKPLYKEILLKSHDQMNAMLFHHCKIMVLRFDFRMIEYTQDNTTISNFFRITKKQLTNNYNFKRIGHIWVREQNISEKQHYHCALMLDANKVRHPSKIIERFNRISETHGHLPPFIPKNCYYIINRGDLEAFGSALFRLSYLAKVETKQLRTGANNDYSSSRIPAH